MNQFYPERHHPIFMLQDALEDAGIPSTFHRDDVSRNLWALQINGKLLVWLIDIRWQHEKDAHEADIRILQNEGALICCAQKPDAAYFNARWLPLAATPGYTPPREKSEALVDLAMVGYVRDKWREQLLLDLNARYSVSVAQGVFGEEAVQTYHQAKLGINIPTRYGDPLAYDSANMRCYEILASGTPLITSLEPYLSELGLIAGENCFTYASRKECLDVVRIALDSDNLQAIGLAGANLVASRHTYSHRAKQVMEWLS